MFNFVSAIIKMSKISLTTSLNSSNFDVKGSMLIVLIITLLTLLTLIFLNFEIQFVGEFYQNLF